MLLAYLYALMQRLLPKHLLTTIVHGIARIRIRAIKDALIRGFVTIYKVELDAVARPVPDGFESFNDFFTRELKAGARPVDTRPGVIVSPVDGTVSESGHLDGDRVLQAKGRYYRLEDLLATDLPDVERYQNGAFATIYLAPYNYHRVHSPMAGELTALRYVPGRLFSVDARTVATVDGLFSGNERLVCHFRTAAGPMVLIFVGAMLVGSISTQWTGEIRPRRSGVVTDIDIHRSGAGTAVASGETIGWFNMGSTVILLLPPERCEWNDEITSGVPVVTGRPIGRLSGPADA